jgi:threonine dehydratase
MKHVTYEDVTDARRRISQYIHRTPVVTSSYVDGLFGGQAFFKCENFQKVGAFKVRGATNAVLSLGDAEASLGVVTHSSGNHGQAVAYACNIRGIPATVVMPEQATAVKIAAVRGYGAEVVLVPRSERESAVAELQSSLGLTLIHPFDNPRVIAGQGTAALELVEDVEDIDILLAPIGGGGLLAGTTTVAAGHQIRAVGTEPELVDDAFRSLRDGVRYGDTGELSVGDGLLTGIGVLPYEMLRKAGTEILLVSEEDILAAMRMFATRLKLVVEPSGATVLAALVRHRAYFEGKRVGAIISGGNVDMSQLSS